MGNKFFNWGFGITGYAFCAKPAIIRLPLFVPCKKLSSEKSREINWVCPVKLQTMRLPTAHQK